MNRAKAKQICIEQARKIASVTICKVEGVAGDFETFEFAVVLTPIMAKVTKLRFVCPPGYDSRTDPNARTKI